jgi:N-acetylglutamate synthase-like GNAT family acetyltransferase
VEQPLLVRAAQPADRPAAAGLVGAAGWSAEQRRAWQDGAPAIVLYDPADAAVHGVVVARPRGPGVFDLVAWAVAPPLNRATAAARLVGAIANRARRDGGERLVVSVQDKDAGALLEACGFQEVSRSHSAFAPESVVTYHLEL